MSLLNELVIATGNPSKKDRYAKLFSQFVPKVLGLSDFSFSERANEVGTTAEENALLKARFYQEKTSLPVFAEDESLFVDFLPENEQPGVFVRRINGKTNATDEELIRYWEDKLVGVPDEQRFGRWHTAFALALPTGEVRIEAIEYPIKFFSPTSSIRLLGWPMSSLEGPVRFNKPHSELTAEERRITDEESDVTISRMLALLFKG